MAPARTPLAELEDGQRVAGVYAVRERELRRKRNGDPWLKLTLGDSSGSVEAVAWEEAEALYALAAPGTPVFVTGTFEVSDRWGSKIKLTELREAREGEYETEELAARASVSVDRLESDLRELLATVQDPQLRELLDLFFGEGSPIWDRFRDAPGGEGLPPGLQPRAARAHGLGRAGGLGGGGVLPRDRSRRRRQRRAPARHRQDQAYNDDPLAIDLTDAGRLQGEIPLGYYLVRRRIEDIPGFDPALAQAVLHIILSHHGSLEHGSPVRARRPARPSSST